MGGVFARAFLKSGAPVYPVLRDTSTDLVAEAVGEPALAMVTVGEADLHPALATLPDAWKRCVGLLQNELLPRDWERHGISDPTVAVVWFEKKPGQDVKVIIPTPVAGPFAGQLVAALDAINIAALEVGRDDLLYELVRKNLYILTVNIAGLVTGGTVGDLWDNHQDLARSVAEEILMVQHWLCGHTFDSEQLIAGMVEAIAADPEHKAMGRSAPGRLDRAIRHAETAGIEVPVLRQIQRDAG
jgi:hypothetical protein